MLKGNTFAKAAMASVALLVGSYASALTITPTGPGLIGTLNPSPNPNTCEPDCIPGADSTWVLAYKADQKDDSPAEESGFLSGAYQTTFSNTPNDPSDADIVWVGPQILDCSVVGKCLMAVKDGRQDPYYYFFDLFSAQPPGGWNGTETINLRGFWPEGGAISHVSIWVPDEDDCCEKDVPEPGTLALLGLGLIGLGAARRRKTK